MADILALLAGGKPKKGSGSSSDMPDDAPSSSSGSDSAERSYAREAFSAAKDDDEEGFITALIGTIRACQKKNYADDESEPDDTAAEE